MCSNIARSACFSNKILCIHIKQVSFFTTHLHCQPHLLQNRRKIKVYGTLRTYREIHVAQGDPVVQVVLWDPEGLMQNLTIGLLYSKRRPGINIYLCKVVLFYKSHKTSCKYSSILHYLCYRERSRSTYCYCLLLISMDEYKIIIFHNQIYALNLVMLFSDYIVLIIVHQNSPFLIHFVVFSSRRLSSFIIQR